MFKRTVCTVISCLPLALAGCAAHPEPPATADDAPAPDADSTPPDEMVSSVARCAAVQQSQELPVSCSFDIVNDRPHMLLGVPNEEVLAANINDMLEQLVAPFCSGQNKANQPSGVIFAVGTREKVMDCATLQMSDWVETDPVVARTVAIEQACSTVERGNYGVNCSLMDLEGLPALILSYERSQQALNNLVQIAGDVGKPFCELANATNVRATMVFLDEQMTGQLYDCATSQVSKPISFRKQRKPAPRHTPQPPKTTPGGNAGQPQQVASNFGERWELLPVHSR